MIQGHHQTIVSQQSKPDSDQGSGIHQKESNEYLSSINKQSIA